MKMNFKIYSKILIIFYLTFFFSSLLFSQGGFRGDNLGDHKARKELSMESYRIKTSSSIEGLKEVTWADGSKSSTAVTGTGDMVRSIDGVAIAKSTTSNYNQILATSTYAKNHIEALEISTGTIFGLWETDENGDFMPRLKFPVLWSHDANGDVMPVDYVKNDLFWGMDNNRDVYPK